MPASNLIPELKYRWSGQTSQRLDGRDKTSALVSYNADFYLFAEIEQRISVFVEGGIAHTLLVFHMSITSPDGIGSAGNMRDWWDRQPTHPEQYVGGPDLIPKFYRDPYGQWWEQTHGCEYTKCDDGRGAWCCRNTMKGWPFREDEDAEYSPCKMLQTDLACSLHKSHLGKPFQCVFSPAPKDLMFYVKGGKCTVRWKPIDKPEGGDE